MAVTRWDGRIFGRSLALAGVAAALGCLLTAATDEGGLRWGERLGRTLPLIPLCSAVAVWGALSSVRSRGEGLALAALGRTRAEVSAPAVAGAATTAVVAGVLLVVSSHAVSVAGFYPSAARATDWRWSGGAFVDAPRHVRLREDGTPITIASAAAPGLAPVVGMAVPAAVAGPIAEPARRPPGVGADRIAAALATVFSGLAFSLLVAHALLAGEAASSVSSPPSRRVHRTNQLALMAAVGGSAVSVVLFQAAAANLLPPILAAIPPFALLGFALTRYRADP